MRILVSACLLGVDCRYDGGSKIDSHLKDFLSNHEAIPVCPEQLGGLTTPRAAAEIQGGTGKSVLEGKTQVINKVGEDVTAQFIKGAEETLKLAKLFGCSAAILKARSPSCGCGKIYNGTFTGMLLEGNGVCTQLLLDNGILVYTEENFKKL